jgi:uncharacterized protein
MMDPTEPTEPAAIRPPRRMLRRATIIGVALLLAAAITIGSISWVASDGLIHPERDAYTRTPADLNLTYEAFNLSTSDGIRLSAWWMPAPNVTTAPAVLYLHGYGDSMNQSLRVAPFLVEGGYHVLAFDFRAHGTSDGPYTTVGLDEVRDVKAALDWLSARADVDANRIAVLGVSMGAATGINAAAQDDRIVAVVADSGFAKLGNIVKNSISHFTGLPRYPFGPLSVHFASLRIGIDVGDNQPANAVTKFSAPILVIQGEPDNIVIAKDDGEVIAKAAGDRAEYWLVPGAKHAEAVKTDPEAYRQRVLDFLLRAMPATP